MEMERLFDTASVLRNRRRAFAASAPGSDFLLNLVVEELAGRLATVERHFNRAIALHAHTALMAQSMIASGKVDRVDRIEQHADFLAPVSANSSGVVADLDTFPVADESVGLVISPLSMHLVNDLPGLLLQIRRSLHPDGLFLAALPGSGTLSELRDCLLQAETELTGGASPRVIPFADVRDCGALLQRAGFSLPVADCETYTVRYDTMFDLMKDLRSMGMGNPLTARSRRPVPRQLFLRAAQIYADEHADADGRIRASFRILYLSGWAPHENQQQPLAPGSAKVSLHDVLGKPRSD